MPCNPLSITETDHFDNLFSVYPSPASDWFIIRNNNLEGYIEEANGYTIDLVDQVGRTVRSSKLRKVTTVNIKTLPHGIYTLIVYNKHQMFTKKMIVE